MNKTIKKLIFLLNEQQKTKLIILFFVIFFISLFDLLSIGLILPILIFFLDENFLNNKFLSILMDNLTFLNQNNFIFYALSTLFIIFVSKTFFHIFLNYFKYKIIMNIYYEISKKLMSIYLNLPYLEFTKLQIFKKINIIRTEVESIVLGLVDPFLILLLEIFIVIFLCTFLIIYDPIISYKVIIFAVFVLFFLNIFFSKQVKNIGAKRYNSANFIQKNIIQGLQGIKDIKIAIKEDSFLKRFSEESNNMSKIMTILKTIQETTRLLIELIALISIFLIGLFSVYSNQENTDFLILLGIFAAATFKIMPSLNRIIVSINSIKATHTVVDAIYDDFKLENKFRLLKKNKKIIFESRWKEIKKIEIKKLSFRYNKKDNFIFKNLNINIFERNYIGIYGKSGSGKTTFIDLFSGLISPQNGKIKCNGLDISNNYLSWRSNIGYVPQSIYLLNDTLKNNIAIGEFDEEIDIKRINRVIKESRLEEFVNKLPKGLNSLISESGINLSGGQIQRIGIARALYRQPKILIFDEATNSLDNKTEKEFMRIVNNLSKKKIIIFVTHNLSLLRNCTSLYELENSKFKKRN